MWSPARFGVRIFPVSRCLRTTRRVGERRSNARCGTLPRSTGSPTRLTRDARATVADIKRFIARAEILTLPDPDRCRVIEMPEFQRGNSIAYMASPPPLDPDATGHYAISPPPASWDEAKVKSFLEEYNRHMLQILTIHEAYPGHYVQMEYANRSPSLIRKILGSGVYIEGWAVYTEQMMLDQGYGDGDPALRLSQLKFYLRAVANTILDYRMHCEQMTDDEAMDLHGEPVVPVRGRGAPQGHSRQAELGAALHLFHRAHGALPTPPANTTRTRRPLPPGAIPRGRAGAGRGADEIPAGAGPSRIGIGALSDAGIVRRCLFRNGTLPAEGMDAAQSGCDDTSGRRRCRFQKRSMASRRWTMVF